MTWTIDKEFSFCYGHRTWVQELIEGYAEDSFCLSCRRLHGHGGTVHVFLESDVLTPQQMVTDFRNMSFYKQFLDNKVDHRFILDTNDPLVDVIINGVLDLNAKTLTSTFAGTVFDLEEIKMAGVDQFIGHTVNLTGASGLTKEFYESFVFVDFCPTSENLAKWMYGIMKEKMSRIGVTVSKIELNETPKSRAAYFE